MLLLLLACAPEREVDKSSETDEATDTAVDTAVECEPTTWYEDADGDGYGDQEVEACEVPAGASAEGGDCDDTDPAVNPGAVEDCATTANDDCAGTVNEEDALHCTDLYPDADADGVGAGDGACLCRATSTYTATVDGDCDDADPSRSESCEMPGTVRIEGGWLRDAALVGDVDGDGSPELQLASWGETALVALPQADAPVADIAVTWTPPNVVAEDLSGGGTVDLLWTDSSHYSDYWGESVRFTVSVQRGPLPVVAGTADLVLDSDPMWGLGTYDSPSAQVAGGRDIDGDGLPDALAAIGRAFDGSAWLLPTGASGTASFDTPVLDLHSGVAQLSLPGDLDGDGFDEVVVVEAPDPLAQVYRGPIDPAATALPDAYVSPVSRLYGAADADGDGYLDAVVQGEAGVQVYRSTPDGASTLWMEVEADTTGAAFADVDGDGAVDLVVGVGTTGDNYGGAYVFRAPGSGWYTLPDADRSLIGGIDGDSLGFRVAALPDRDDDGAEDIAVGSDFGVYVFASL